MTSIVTNVDNFVRIDSFESNYNSSYFVTFFDQNDTQKISFLTTLIKSLFNPDSTITNVDNFDSIDSFESNYSFSHIFRTITNCLTFDSIDSFESTDISTHFRTVTNCLIFAPIDSFEGNYSFSAI